MHSDSQLVRAAQGGQERAFAALVERTQNMARAIAFSASGDYGTAEELVQEAYLTAWTRLADLKEPSKFRPWLAGIVRNSARYARRHRRRHAPLALESIEKLASLPSPQASPLDQVQSRQRWQQAAAALRVLPSRYREPLLLYYTLGESHEEVASALGLSEAAVRQRLCRARKRLRDVLLPAEECGRKLAGTASAAAGILVLLQGRRSLAAQLTSQAAAASASPKIFVALGALSGSAFMVCVAALALLITGTGESSAALAASDSEAPSRKAVQEEDPSAKPASEPSVHMGRGEIAAPTGTAEPEREDSAAPSLSAGGRIHRHGPAILHLDENSTKKPLLRPSLNARELDRLRWTLD